MQWAVSISRYDIHTAVMTMSGFRVQPRTGHLDQVKRMYGYLCKFKHYKIRFRTEEIDYSMVPHQEYDWDNTPYGNEKELLPTDAPPPLGMRVVLTHYFNTNLMHDVLLGKAVTGCFQRNKQRLRPQHTD